MERFKVMKASGSKHSLNKYYGATAEDLENTAGLLEMTSVLGNSQIDENASGGRSGRADEGVGCDIHRRRFEPGRGWHFSSGKTWCPEKSSAIPTRAWHIPTDAH
eukprot:XP_016658388.1 PREDICTED: uncharacterized protein LOC107883238 [Acyrthosiphon pisum]